MIAAPIRGSDAVAQLIRRISLLARTAGLELVAEELKARPWASATFVGTQVTMLLTAPRAPALGRWLSDLSEAEVAMRGHVLASLSLDRIEDDGEYVRTTLTALVIED